MAIVSHKVQTTRHRIKAILTEKGLPDHLSDTPGIIEPRYKLHENDAGCKGQPARCRCSFIDGGC